MKPVHEPVSSRPTPCAPLKKPHESCPFATPCCPLKEKNRPWLEINFSLRNITVRAIDSHAQGFSTPLARQRSGFPPPSSNLVRTPPIEHYQALHDSATAPRVPPHLPEDTKLVLGGGAHLETPPLANYTAATSQPTGWIAKAISWLHLSKSEPHCTLLRETPSHTPTLKSVFGGRGRMYV